jgi:hypothetical protein
MENNYTPLAYSLAGVDPQEAYARKLAAGSMRQGTLTDPVDSAWGGVDRVAHAGLAALMVMRQQNPMRSMWPAAPLQPMSSPLSANGFSAVGFGGNPTAGV